MRRPVYHDELAYLLAADTFVHGRLTNPPHPQWRHFESFHILHQPTYASKYPPGQGLVLALGQWIGAPIVGVWLGVAAMCGAITWMLRGYLAPAWATFGGLLVIVQIALGSYWSQSYWGGGVAAFAGALVFGALPRIVRRRARDVSLASPLVLGSGLIVLANTRPFEGALVSLAAALPLLGWLLRERRSGREGGHSPRRAGGGGGQSWLRVVAPIVVVLVVGLLAMARYNRAVTGDALRLPYSLHDEQYLVQPLFVLQPPRPVPEYRHQILHRFFADFGLRELESQNTLAGWAKTRLPRLEKTRAVLLGPVLTLPLLVVPWSRRLRGMTVALAGVALLLVTVALTNYHNPHYAAPAFALVILIVVQGWRLLVLAGSRRGGAGARARRRRRELLMAAVVVAAVAARLAIADPVLGVGAKRSANQAKATVERQLENLGGRHLVFVEHGPFADVHDEWVWNGADIDAQPIVFARAMRPADDAELRAYYPDRRAWRVEIGRDRPGVVDYEEIASGAVH